MVDMGKKRVEKTSDCEAEGLEKPKMFKSDSDPKDQGVTKTVEVIEVKKKFTDEQIARLIEKGLGYAAVTEMTGIGSDKFYRIKKLVAPLNDSELALAKKGLPAKFIDKMNKALEHINDDKLESAKLFELSGAVKIMHDAARLQMGESTENIASQHVLTASSQARTILDEAVVRKPKAKEDTDNLSDEPDTQSFEIQDDE